MAHAHAHPQRARHRYHVLKEYGYRVLEKISFEESPLPNVISNAIPKTSQAHILNLGKINCISKWCIPNIDLH